MTDAEIVQNFKLVQEQINALSNALNEYVQALHKSNSDAIDEIVVSLLNQDNGGETDV